MNIQPSMISNPIFGTALIFTLQAEGGFVDNPADPGGATNRGITQNTYDTFRTDRGLNTQSVRDIADHEVQDIYQQMYWVPAHCAELSPKLAVCHFDWAVNHGVHGAIETLQDTLNIQADGIFGPKTRQALELMPQDDLIAEYLANRRDWYEARAKTKPDQAVFLKGWLDRCDALAKYLGMQS